MEPLLQPQLMALLELCFMETGKGNEMSVYVCECV